MIDTSQYKVVIPCTYEPKYTPQDIIKNKPRKEKIKLEETLKIYREYRNFRSILGLPDFTTNNPNYIPGQELEYTKKQIERLSKGSISIYY